MFKGNRYPRAKGVIIGRPPAECWPFSRALVWDLDLHILFTTRLTLHNKRKFVAYFAKCREIRVFIKRSRREKSRESPSQINLSYVFFFPTLLCALFPLMNFRFRFNSCSQFREMTFLANFKGVLCHAICQGVRCCDSLVGGMTALIRA